MSKLVDGNGRPLPRSYARTPIIATKARLTRDEDYFNVGLGAVHAPTGDLDWRLKSLDEDTLSTLQTIDVLEGVDAVKRLLKRPNGIIFNKALLSHPPCEELLELKVISDPFEEFQTYCYPPVEKRTGDARKDDKPVKGNDDFCDTVRYHVAEFLEFVKYVRIGGTARPPEILPKYLRG